jgi:phage host-nuclease inhibitor protein Gam
MRKRQKMADALGKAEEELDMLRQKTGNGNGAGLEEALRAKEEELNRIKNDYATKMKNSLALQRIRYEREIDNLRKEIRKATMGREEVAEEIHKRESELAERENQAKRMELEVSELKKRLEAEAANVKKAEAV